MRANTGYQGHKNGVGLSVLPPWPLTGLPLGELDAKYVKKVGDSMQGALEMQGGDIKIDNPYKINLTDGKVSAEIQFLPNPSPTYVRIGTGTKRLKVADNSVETEGDFKVDGNALAVGYSQALYFKGSATPFVQCTFSADQTRLVNGAAADLTHIVQSSGDSKGYFTGNPSQIDVSASSPSGWAILTIEYVMDVIIDTNHGFWIAAADQIFGGTTEYLVNSIPFAYPNAIAASQASKEWRVITGLVPVNPGASWTFPIKVVGVGATDVFTIYSLTNTMRITMRFLS